MHASCVNFNVPIPIPIRFLLAAFIVSIGFVTAAPSALENNKSTAATTTSDEIFELPQLTVIGERILPDPETWWTYSRHDNFEILSELSERKTRDFVKYFGKYINVITSIMPATRLRTPIPIKIILCDRGSTFSKFGDIWTRRALSFFDGEQVVFVLNLSVDNLQIFPGNRRPNDKTAGNSSPDIGGVIEPENDASDFDINKNIDFGEIETSGAQSLSNLGQITTTAVQFDPVNAALKAIEGEYLHVYFAKLAQPPPEWFMAAMMRMFVSMESWRNKVMIGGSGSNFASFAGFDWLARGAIVPLRQVVGSEPLDKRFTRGQWGTVSFAFMHYCLYRHKSKLQSGFLKFLTLSGKVPVDESVFKKCFGMSYKTMERELVYYARYTNFKQQEYTFKDDTMPKDITVRPATEPEVGRIKGEALLLAGKNISAQIELTTPYFHKNTDLELLGSLALFLLKAENSDRARRIAELAYKGGCKRPRLCLAVANERLQSAIKTAPGKNKDNPDTDDIRIDKTQMESVLAAITDAFGGKPVVPGVYELLAMAWMVSPVPPQPSHFDQLLEGCRIFPDNPELAHRTATLLIEHGQPETARRLTERWSDNPGSDTARQHGHQK
jgi:hypothetical protein